MYCLSLAAVIGFARPTYEVEEDDGLVGIVVIVDGELARDVLVQFDTTNYTTGNDNCSKENSEECDPDFTPKSETLTFNAENMSFTVNVRIEKDFVDEPQESFNATLVLVSTDATGVKIEPNVVQVFINNTNSKL